MKIDGEFLSNLRFADDIFLCTETPQELQQMLQEQSDESRRKGINIYIAKTKVMVVDNTHINVNNVLIYHKFRNNKLPYYIQNWPLFQNSNIHNHNTRGANALHKNRCLHVFAQKSLKLNITNIVNDTPHIILEKIDTHSLNGFTNYVKLFLLQTYQDTCTVPNCYICFALEY